MNISLIKGHIKKTLIKGAKKFLSAEVREELGVDKQNINLNGNPDDTLNSFWDPVQKNNLTNKDNKNIASWGIGIVVAVSVLLFVVFSALLTPNKNHINLSEDTTIVVDGESIEKKIVEAQSDSEEVNEGLQVQNIKTEESDEVIEDSVVAESPLLQSSSASITEYHVQYGDTLENISTKFYGSYSYEKIQKIKTANNIRNPRSLQIGQKLIIPF